MVRKFLEHSLLRSESSTEAKVRWNESSWTFRSPGANVPRNESSTGAKVLSMVFSLPGTKVQRNEKASYPPPDPLAGFKGGLLLKQGRRRRRGEGKGEGGERKGSSPPLADSSGSAPAPRPSSWNQGAILLRGGKGEERSLKIWTPQTQKPSYAPQPVVLSASCLVSELVCQRDVCLPALWHVGTGGLR